MHKVFNDPLLAMEPPIALVTLRRQDGSEALLCTSAAPLLANLDGEHEANAGPGESYKVSAPRVPRNRPLFKSDEQMRAEGWEPTTSREAVVVYVTLLSILAAVFSVWAYWTWVA